MLNWLNWWYDFLPTIFQDQWIGVKKIENIETVYNAYKVKSNFLNPDFLDSYLPSQPNLLCAIIVLLLFSAIIFLLFCAFCLAERIGTFRKRKSYFSAFSSGAQSPSKKKIFDGESGQSLTAAYASLWLSWAVLFAVGLLLAGCVADFVTVDAEADGAPITVSQNVTANLTSAEEENLISKFNDIRELGYEFKPLENDTTNFSKYFLLMTVIGMYGICLVITPIAVAIGMRQQRAIERHTAEYDYTFDFYGAAHLTKRVGRTLFACAAVLFALCPLINLLGAALIVHSHAHTAICPFDQTVTQNANIEAYVNQNYELFESVSLVDFLGDLSHERVEINRANCAEHVRPIQGMWACLLVLAWLSLALIAAQAVVARRFLSHSDDSWSALAAENSAAITAGWPNYAPEADTYAAAVDAYSKYSFGTFVYQKY